MPLINNEELSDIGLDELAEKIDDIISNFKRTKSKILKREFIKSYILLTDEYHNRTGNKNIYHKSLESIK